MATQSWFWGSVTDPKSPTNQASMTVTYDDRDLSVISVVINNPCPDPVLAWVKDTATGQNDGATVAANSTHTFNAPNNKYFLVNDPVWGIGPGSTVELGLGF